MYKIKFYIAQRYLEKRGHVVMNPAILPKGYEWEDYMNITMQMLEASDVVLTLPDWYMSRGAKVEVDHAKLLNKPIWSCPTDLEKRIKILQKLTI